MFTVIMAYSITCPVIVPFGLIDLFSFFILYTHVRDIPLTFTLCVQVCCTSYSNTWWTNTTCTLRTCRPASIDRFTWELSIKRWLHQSYACSGFISSPCSGQVTAQIYVTRTCFVVHCDVYRCFVRVSAQASWQTRLCLRWWFCA